MTRVRHQHIKPIQLNRSIINKKNAASTRWIQRFRVWSGRRDSNPQPSAWEADALPLRHSRDALITP
jgi:hypothetical protein